MTKKNSNPDAPDVSKRPKPPAAPPKMKSPKKETSSATSTAHFNVQRDEKRVVVFIEIGDNLQKTLDKALEAAYQGDESIGDTMSEMGVNLKEMVESAVQMEIATEDKVTSNAPETGRKITIRRGDGK